MESLSELKELDKKITINVGGQRYETWASTLERLPGTRLALLAHLLEADESWDPDLKEYFFDRHPGAFVSVIHYYRTEELHPDQSICGNVMKGELEFWGLSEMDIEPCCWGHYSKFKDHKDALAALDNNFTGLLDCEAWGETMTNAQRFKQKIWRFLEDPGSSRQAQVYAVVSMGFVLLSIGVFVLETHKLFRIDKEGLNSSDTSTVTYRPCTTVRNAGRSCFCPAEEISQILSTTEAHPAMIILDYICAAFFTIELLARVFFCSKKKLFFKEMLNIIDIVCLVPQFIAIIIKTVDEEDSATSSLFKTILALRIIRVLRIFKLMKHYSAFKILVYTIKVSTKELFLIIIFLFTGVLIFASVIFYIDPATFDSIPTGFWWALVTMTTVGYGDKVPNTEFGYIIGSVCVICGVLTIAFTVPIVVNNFTLYYSHAQSRIKLPIGKRKEIKRRQQSRNQKATMDFVRKVAFTMNDFNNLEDLKSPRDSSPRDSGKGFTGVHPLQPTGFHLDAISEASSETLTTSTTVGSLSPPPVSKMSKSNIEDNLDERKEELEPSEKVRTISGSIIDELDLHLPLSRLDSGLGGSRHRLESEQLLNDLADANQKQQIERERQLDRLRLRRDNLLSQRGTPRPSPSPAKITPR